MTDDIKKQMEVATLMPDRYYLILNEEDEDSFSMSAYDTTKELGDNEEIPAGLVVLNGIIEMLENDFETLWAAGTGRLSFVSMVNDLEVELEDDGVSEITQKVLEREDNILKVNFGDKQ